MGSILPVTSASLAYPDVYVLQSLSYHALVPFLGDNVITMTCLEPFS